MKLQDRDIEIIKYLEEFKGATIEQISLLFFKGSYDAAKKRLKLLEDSKQLRGQLHEVLNKKVYFIEKCPSYHRIITNEVRIILLQSVQLIDFKYEAKIDKYKVDAMAVYKKDKVCILLIEIDIFNRSKDEKLINVKNTIKQKTGTDPTVAVVSRHKRREKKGVNVKCIGVNEIKNLLLSI